MQQYDVTITRYPQPDENGVQSTLRVMHGDRLVQELPFPHYLSDREVEGAIEIARWIVSEDRRPWRPRPLHGFHFPFD
jgi:hypothetical protein